MGLTKNRKIIVYMISIIGIISMLALGILCLGIEVDPNMPLVFVASVIGIMAILGLGLVDIRFLFYAWIVTLPFAQWSLYDLGSMNLYVDRIILIFLLLFSLCYVSMRKITFSKISVVELLMLGFTLVCLISTSKANSLDRIGFGTLLSAYILPFFAYYIAKSFIQNTEDLRSFSVVITLFSIYLAYVGICEQIFPDLVFPRYIVNPKYIITGVGRSVGPSLEPVGYGVGLVFCLLLSIYLFSKINNPLNPQKMLAFLSILITPIAICFTYTRSVWAALISSLCVSFLFYPRGKRIFGSLLLILLVGFLAIQAMRVSKTEGSAKTVLRRETVSFHIFMPITGIRMFLEKPIFGFGQFQFKDKYSPYIKATGDYEVPDEGFLVHNTFINILVELGLIGFIPFFFILAYLIRDAINLYRTSVENRDIAIIFLAACAAFVTAGMANNMHYKFAHVLLFSMAGMTKGLLQGKTLSKERPALESKAAYT